MTEKKYLIRPGRVTSQWDGDIHYISARRLMQLYGVERKECVIDGPMINEDDLITLTPQRDGDYNIPSQRQNPC